MEWGFRVQLFGCCVFLRCSKWKCLTVVFLLRRSMFVLLRSLGFMYIYVDASVGREPTSTPSLARFPKIPTGNPDTKLL